MLLARNNPTDFLTDLGLITAPGGVEAGGPRAVPEPSAFLTAVIGLIFLGGSRRLRGRFARGR